MRKEQEIYKEDSEFGEILSRFEGMVENDKLYYFDVYQFERIIDYYLDGDFFSKAIRAVDIGIGQHPSSSTLLIKKAQIFAEKGDAAKAMVIIKDIEQAESSNNELYILMGMVYNQMGKINEAEKAFEKAISLTFDSRSEVLHDIAQSFEYIHQYKTALKYLKKAYTIDPEKLSLIHDLASCYEKVHEFNRSIDFYKKYLDKEPFAENIWYNLGLVYFKMEDYDKAIDAYDFSIAVNDKFSSAVLNKAIALSYSGRYGEAVETYYEFLALEPDHIIAHCYLGECYEKLGQYNEALKSYSDSLNLDPEFPEAWYGQALCYKFLGQYRDALYHVKKAIEFDDENPDYWFTLGNIQIHLGDYRNAVTAFDRATTEDPYDYEAWLMLAELGFILSGPDKAINILNESYSYTFDIAGVNFHLAAYYCLSGQKEMFYKYFEKGLGLSYNEHTLTFKVCPEARNDKIVQNLLSNYNLKS